MWVLLLRALTLHDTYFIVIYHEYYVSYSWMAKQHRKGFNLKRRLYAKNIFAIPFVLICFKMGIIFTNVTFYLHDRDKVPYSRQQLVPYSAINNANLSLSFNFISLRCICIQLLQNAMANIGQTWNGCKCEDNYSCYGSLVP